MLFSSALSNGTKRHGSRWSSAHPHQLFLRHMDQLSNGFAEKGHPPTNLFLVLQGHHEAAHLRGFLLQRGIDSGQNKRTIGRPKINEFINLFID